MKLRVAQLEDIETLFDIRTNVIENYQSREEIAELGITPESVSVMLQTDCCGWIAEISGQPIGFSIANATEKTICLGKLSGAIVPFSRDESNVVSYISSRLTNQDLKNYSGVGFDIRFHVRSMSIEEGSLTKLSILWGTWLRDV